MAAAKRAKMTDDDLLSMLQTLEDDSSQYTFGELQAQRRAGVKAYYQRPYGNEEEGWSGAIPSDVQDTIEWMLPDLLDMFLSTDDAVVFDPTREDEAEGAEQATDTCNYVFYKQNNGFLVLYTAFKDALMEKTGITHWTKQTKRVRKVEMFEGATLEQIRMKLDEFGKDAEVIAATPLPPQPVTDPATGQPVTQLQLNPLGQAVPAPVMGPQTFKVRISRVTERRTIRVDAVPPENLLVSRGWSSPMLESCPYVCRFMEVSLSDINELAEQMGFDAVTAEELAGSDEPSNSAANDTRTDRTGVEIADTRRMNTGIDEDDESLTMGWLRVEWVLADFDGDGIAERREIWRLDDRILSNEECSEVPVAIGSPILVQHQWDGLSVADLIQDLQRIRADLLRAALNNASLAGNPRKTVLVDRNGAPQVDVDDLLDYRPGGATRVYSPNALGVENVPFVANNIFPIMEYVDGMREQRTGVTKQRMGQNDANALQAERTLGETQIVDAASRQRIKLIARVLAECLVKPTFKGILRLLTEGDMEPIAFRLRGKFVQYDPNDWQDQYDMTSNVGLGTGDREQKIAVLRGMVNDQMALAPTPLGVMMVTPEQIYNTRAMLADLSGFKNVDQFYTNPGKEAKLPTKPPEPPPYQLQIEEMRQRADAQKFQAESAQEFAKNKAEEDRKQRELDAQNEMQRQNDERDAEVEKFKAEKEAELEAMRLQIERYKVDKQASTSLMVAKIAHPEGALPEGWGIDPQTGMPFELPDPIAPVMQALAVIAEQQSAPKAIVRDEAGNVVGVAHNGTVRPVVRDENGRVAGLA